MILLFLCIFVNETHGPYFASNILLNCAHDSEANKVY